MGDLNIYLLMKHTIPNNWDEVPLNVGRKIFSINASGKTDSEYLEQVLNCFDIDLTPLSIEEVNIYKSLVYKLLSVPPKDTLEDVYYIGGVRYRLITDLKQLTFGEFLDIEFILSGENLNIWDVIHQLLGILLREEVKVKKSIFSKSTFKILEHNADNVFKNAELFDKVLSVNDVYGFATFFLLQGMVYSQTLLYLYQTQKKS